MAIAWDYEEDATTPYYHVYAVGGPLDNDDHDISIILTIPRTHENDQGCQAVIEALQAIAARVKESIGRCGSCRFRDADGYCTNENFEQGTLWEGVERAVDKLIYSYDEGGCFYVGPQFGCVHYEKRQ